MELAGTNQLFPDNPAFALPPLETGDRSAGSGTTTRPYIPPVLLKAIAYIESGWAQASYDPLVQYGETGPTLVSADCGYGIMQVTSGMQNVSGIPEPGPGDDRRALRLQHRPRRADPRPEVERRRRTSCPSSATATRT